MPAQNSIAIPVVAATLNGGDGGQSTLSFTARDIAGANDQRLNTRGGANAAHISGECDDFIDSNLTPVVVLGFQGYSF